MISPEQISKLVASYGAHSPSDITIGVLGGHSALDVCAGAKKYGFKTVAVCKDGRSSTYSKYFKTRDAANRAGDVIGCIDDVIILPSFGDIVNPEVQERLRKMKTIFVHNRYFWVYCDFNKIENDFNVPIFGTRHMLKLEERDQPNNQYYLLKQAGIRTPKIFGTVGEIFEKKIDINQPVMVKVNEATRGYERAFFVATTREELSSKADELMAKGTITKEGLMKAVVEEFIIGAQVNINYFYTPYSNEVEVMGTDMRRQTNLDGLLRMPARQQMLLPESWQPKMVETGHVAVTVKESLLEKMYDLGERFVKTTQKECAPGIIGPFALQGAVTAEEGKEEFVIFDVSMRIPGSPGTRFTPYTGYLYGENISVGERVAMEIAEGIKQGKLDRIVT
ncbi:DUF1297 domain-containing protein [Candidatus Gracilibacteria bacterium]|nr:DUF1297 domain-containing protein [Candidatus Gracilibacteria bacterium]